MTVHEMAKNITLFAVAAAIIRVQLKSYAVKVMDVGVTTIALEKEN